MFSTQKIAQHLRFVSKKLATTFKNNQRPIENAAFFTATAVSAYCYPELSHRMVKSHVNLFKSRLTLEQRKEMESSPEKNAEYREECRRGLAFSLRE